MLTLHPHAVQVTLLLLGSMLRQRLQKRSWLKAVRADPVDPFCRLWDAHHGGCGIWLHPSHCAGACGNAVHLTSRLASCQLRWRWQQAKHRAHNDSGSQAPVASGHLLLRSTATAVRCGCLQDDVQSFLESVLPYERFSLRLPKCEIPQLDRVLRSISKSEIARLQVCQQS